MTYVRNSGRFMVRPGLGILLATHGEPSVANAHPQVSADGRFYLVHNGVIETLKT